MSLLKSVATVGGCTALSRVVGFIRDVLIARFLGASMMADAFFVALRFPNLFRSLFAEGTLNVAFVPLFSGEYQGHGRRRALVFSRSAFSFLFYVLLIFTAVVELIMPLLMFLLAPGFDSIPGKLELTTSLSRITFPFLMCVSLVSLYSGMLNSLGRFWAAAFVPVILNVSMIVSLYVLTPWIDSQAAPAYALAWGVLIAGIIELVFLYGHVRRHHLTFGLVRPSRALFRLSTQVKTLLKRMGPGVLGSGVYQINLFFDTLFVSFVGAGAISWLNYAHHLFQLPIGIIGVAIGTVLLPVLSRHIKAGEMQEANTQLNRAIEMSLALSLASMAGLIFLAEPIVHVLFERGAFTAVDTIHTSRALAVFAAGLPAYMLTKAFSPFFYARGDTVTPVKIAIAGVVLNAVLALSFMPFWGYLGIAAATGITVWVNALQYALRLKKQGDFHLDALFLYRLPRIIGAALLMALFLSGALKVFVVFYPTWINSLFSGITGLFFLILSGMGVWGGTLLVSGGMTPGALKFFLHRRSKGQKR